MKIFIAGSSAVSELDEIVKAKLFSIYHKGFQVLVGDCYGVDVMVQRFFADLDYNNVLIYASNGIARNNIGNRQIKNVSVSRYIAQGSGEFYRQKDIAMAKDADYGFMIWDGKGLITLENIENMISLNKTVAVYLTAMSRLVLIKDFNDLWRLETLGNNCGEASCTAADAEYTQLLPYIVKDLILYIIEKDGVTCKDALKELYISKLYYALEHEESEIWHHDTGTLYGVMKGEEISEEHNVFKFEDKKLPKEWGYAIDFLEYFKEKKGMNGKKAYEIFDKYDVFDFLFSRCGFLCRTSLTYTYEKVDAFLCLRNAGI